KLARNSGRFPQQLRIEDVELDESTRIGSGGFADVYQGFLRGEMVAVKRTRFRSSDISGILKGCARELVIWARLSHVNILPLRGVFLGKSPESHPVLSFVSPFMEKGDLVEYLRNHETPDRHSLIRDIINGLEYLHTQKPHVIHGDIKTVRTRCRLLWRCSEISVQENIFVSSTNQARIGDFGLSYIKNSDRKRWTSTANRSDGKTLRYSAPELMRDDAPMSRGRDIYAFGCTIFEVRTLAHPLFSAYSHVSL
ncbi:kinase-like protein, partial [Coniophora puteana RWD-64-598 SS2]